MLSYKDLSPAQKRWVDMVEQFFPGVREVGTLNHTELHTIHDYFVSRRQENPRFKISKPIWLITNNAIERGVYVFPSSGVDLQKTDLSEESELDILYRSELMKYGIAPKQ